MSAIFRIKQLSKDYTQAEEKLAVFIVEFPERVLDCSAEVLGGIVGVSAASVIRFSKKLGYKGFTDLKLELAKSIHKENRIFTDEISFNDSLEDIISKTRQIYTDTVNGTFLILDEKKIASVVEYIINSESVYLLGMGASGIACEDLVHKFARLTNKVRYFGQSHLQLTTMAHVGKKDLVIAISYSGETQEIITGVRYARENGATVVTITKMGDNTLKGLGDVGLEIPTTEMDLRLGAVSSRIATNVITDIIYYDYACSVKDLEKKLISTKVIIEDLQT